MLPLPTGKRYEKLFAERIARRTQLLDPGALHVNVAQAARDVKNVAARFLDFAPRGIRRYFTERVRHGAATAQGYAQVVNVVGVPGALHLRGPFENVLHPDFEADSLGGAAGGYRGNFG